MAQVAYPSAVDSSLAIKSVGFQMFHTQVSTVLHLTTIMPSLVNVKFVHKGMILARESGYANYRANKILTPLFWLCIIPAATNHRLRDRRQYGKTNTRPPETRRSKASVLVGARDNTGQDRRQNIRIHAMHNRMA